MSQEAQQGQRWWTGVRERSWTWMGRGAATVLQSLASRLCVLGRTLPARRGRGRRRTSGLCGSAPGGPGRPRAPAPATSPLPELLPPSPPREGCLGLLPACPLPPCPCPRSRGRGQERAQGPWAEGLGRRLAPCWGKDGTGSPWRVRDKTAVNMAT